MAESLADYVVRWDDAPMNIATAIQRIQSEDYPGTLVIDNPNYGYLGFGRTMVPNQFVVQRLGPPLPGIGIRRTFGTLRLPEESILQYIFEVFYNLEKTLGALHTGRQKLTRLQVEGAKKMLNRLENASGKPMNQGVRNRISAMLGERLPVRSAYNVPANMAKINTNLFEREGLNRINTSLFQRRRTATRKSNRKNRKNRRNRRSTRR